MEALASLDLPFVRPRGAFYVYVDVSSTGLPSPAFCLRLLQDTGVMIFPGTMFGSDGDRWVRMSLLRAEAADRSSGRAPRGRARELPRRLTEADIRPARAKEWAHRGFRRNCDRRPRVRSGRVRAPRYRTARRNDRRRRPPGLVRADRRRANDRCRRPQVFPGAIDSCTFIRERHPIPSAKISRRSVAPRRRAASPR